MSEQEVKDGNNLIDIFMDIHSLSNYRKSGMFDKNGVEIIEGHIISANGYNSNIEEKYFHCVEYCDGQFGSDIYSDFEPLSRYQTIEVIGHATEYAHLVEEGDYEGNLPSGIKANLNSEYHKDWSLLMPVISKAREFLQNMERPSRNHCCKGDLIEVDLQCRLWEIDIEKTWKHTVELITWINEYNSQNKNP